MENKLFDFGMIGLGVMGQNLLLNMADHGFAVAGFDKNAQKTTAPESAATAGTTVHGTDSLEHLIQSLQRPRKMMMLVPAGKPVDDVIESLLPLLEKGDIVIDGGNSHYTDTLRRVQYLEKKGFHFMGIGISGGEQGARLQPSVERFLTRSPTTAGSASVETSPRLSVSFSAILRRIRRMILPLRVFGRAGAH